MTACTLMTACTPTMTTTTTTRRRSLTTSRATLEHDDDDEDVGQDEERRARRISPACSRVPCSPGPRTRRCTRGRAPRRDASQCRLSSTTRALLRSSRSSGPTPLSWTSASLALPLPPPPPPPPLQHRHRHRGEVAMLSHLETARRRRRRRRGHHPRSSRSQLPCSGGTLNKSS